MATHHDLKLNNDNNIFSGTWYTCPLHESTSSSTSSSSSSSSRCKAKSNPFLNRRNLTNIYTCDQILTLFGIRWFWIFWYFERNVPLQLPRHYSLPLPRYKMFTLQQQNRFNKKNHQPTPPSNLSKTGTEGDGYGAKPEGAGKPDRAHHSNCRIL